MFIPSRAIKNASSKLLYKTGWVPYGIPFGVKYFSSIEIDDIYQLTIKNGTFWCWNLSGLVYYLTAERSEPTIKNLLMRERKNKCLTEAQELEKAKDKKLRDKEEASRAMDCMELELERRRLEEIEREKCQQEERLARIKREEEERAAQKKREEEVKQREEVLKRDIGKSSKVKKEILVSQEVQDCNVINKNEDSSDDDFTVPPPTISSTTTFKPSPNIPVALPAPPSNAPPMPVSNIPSAPPFSTLQIMVD
ncbi:hypothetical protein F8M41_008140 [Gigaspora margarita]|uniref:Uncharacterized protein n=1 Tax=Gigaspora margarita TaxID=4874 RepID=A0A8H3X6L3_GIGMA|nr:hypothetical protein F8M41_008140 [Gigaspora margarita]